MKVSFVWLRTMLMQIKPSAMFLFTGEKKIITQWVRYGVSKEKPHGAFNTRKSPGSVLQML